MDFTKIPPIKHAYNYVNEKHTSNRIHKTKLNIAKASRQSKVNLKMQRIDQNKVCTCITLSKHYIYIPFHSKMR